ncbi:MAG: O-succinylhomoserine sulfhydrylase [Pseudomonadota bacterium]
MPLGSPGPDSLGRQAASAAWRPETHLVHAGTLRSGFAETSEALFLTQGYVYPDAEAAEERFKSEAGGFIYSRYANPTVAMFEQRMVAFEGAEDARATASGMAAVTASVLSYVGAGDHVVASRALFGSCSYVLGTLAPRFGVTTTFVDGADLGAWRAAIGPNTKLIFFETPANPTLDIIDIAAVAEMAHAVGAIVVVDNVFATPMMQRPLAHGADVVVYSATKHVDGQGRCLGGIVLGPAWYIHDHLHPYLKHTGPSLSPFNAWVLLKGLETLPVRVRAQVENARQITEALAAHRDRYGTVARVLCCGHRDHPDAELIARQMSGGGQIIAIDFAGGKCAAFQFMNALRVISISNNVGDAKSLITHPATTTHQRLSPEERAERGITDGLVRLSVGLEAVDDLLIDIDQALAAISDQAPVAARL